MKSSKILIEHQCPQCGAPATLEETDHLFTCEFCKVSSFLLSRVYRYVLPHKAPADKQLVYVPYWRFKGMLFCCVNNGIRHKIVDVSYQAYQHNAFPATVGLRSQAMKLRFVTPETEGSFVRPSLGFQEVLGIIEARYNLSMPKPIFHQDFIGDSLSVLYSPFYIEDKIYDAVLNRPVTDSIPQDMDVNALAGKHPDWQIRFIPAQCPDCGWDLGGERDSLALNCTNCHAAWQAGKGKFMRLTYALIPPETEDPVYLPFWRIRTEIKGIDLDSYADLVRIANLPKVVQEGWEDRPFLFWSPAFKVRPQDFLRFSKHVTLGQPQTEGERILPKGEVYPVTLPIMEAVAGLKVTLASFIKPPGTMYPILPEIEISPKSFILVYIPFQARRNELTYPQFQLRINRNLLRYARNL